MTLDRSFLADICEHPDDDAPRLIYADWLDDHGQEPRAEFIRVQCELARLDPFDGRRPDLVRRERALFVEHGKKWARAAARLTKRHEFRRGFVHQMTLPIGKFLREADALFATHPIDGMRFLQLTPEYDALLDSPHLGRLRHLNFHFLRLGMRRAVRLVNSPRLAGLASLDLGGTNMLEGGYHALLASPHLGGLKALNVGHLSLGTRDAMERFAAARAFPALTRLDLGSSLLDARGVSHFVRFAGLGQLEELTFDSNAVRDDGLGLLLESKQLGRLRALRLSNNHLTDAGVAALAKCPQLARLEVLTLAANGNCTSARAMRALAGSASLANLRVLDLAHGHHIDEQAVAEFTRAAFAPRLRELELSAMTADGFRALFAPGALTGLWKLALHTAGDYGRQACQELAAATYLDGLTHLDLGGIQPKYDGVKALANAPHLRGLVSLNLAYSRLDENALRALVASPYLPRWCKVDLRDMVPPSPATREALRERFAEVSLAKRR